MKPGTWVSTHPREAERNSSVWSRNPTAAGQGIAPLLWWARSQAAPDRVMVLRFLVTKKPAKAGKEVAPRRPAWTALRAVAYRPRLQDPGRKGPQNIGNTTRIWLAAILQKVSVLMCQWCLFLTGPAATPLCRLRLWRALGSVQNGLGTEGSKGEGMGSAAAVCAAAAEGHHSTTRAGRLAGAGAEARPRAGSVMTWNGQLALAWATTWLWLPPSKKCACGQLLLEGTPAIWGRATRCLLAPGSRGRLGSITPPSTERQNGTGAWGGSSGHADWLPPARAMRQLVARLAWVVRQPRAYHWGRPVVPPGAGGATLGLGQGRWPPRGKRALV